VLIAGGHNGSGTLPTAEVFNPSTNSFSPAGSMTGAREEACAVLLKDGRVLIAGGFISGGGGALDTAELFTPTTNTFAPTGSMTAKRDAPACGRLPDGRVLVTAGGSPSGASAEVFDPASNSFSPISATLPAKIFAPSTAVLPGGRILMAGGYDSTNARYTIQSEVFDPITGTFITGAAAGIGPTIGPRQDAPATTLKDGRVLFAGGFNSDLSPAELASAEVLSVPSNAFKAKLKGGKATFKVTDEGTAMVSDTSVKVATTAKKKKKPKLAKTTTKHGGPGKLVVKVKLTKLGAATLSRKGKLKVRVTYTPDGGLAATKKLKLSAGK
jgi:hypothetical protein